MLELASLGEEFLGEAEIGHDADRGCASLLQAALVAEHLQTLGDLRDPCLVTVHRSGWGLDHAGLRPGVIGAADEHATLPILGVGLSARLAGVGMNLRGLDDLGQPPWRDRVQQMRDPLIDVQRRLERQIEAVPGQQTRLPWRRFTGQNPSPREGKSGPQRQGRPDVVTAHPGRNTTHRRELGDCKRCNRWTPVTTKDHCTLATIARTATEPKRAHVGMETIGVLQRDLEAPDSGPILHRETVSGRPQQVGR